MIMCTVARLKDVFLLSEELFYFGIPSYTGQAVT